MGGTTVSVALCTHNGEQFVRTQLESIFAQTVLPDEIVISDDASTDSTLAVVSAVIAANSTAGGLAPTSVVVLSNATAVGVVGNFEAAICACTGDLIVLCDQDDEWVTNRLELIFNEFAPRPELALLHGDAVLVDANDVALPFTLFGALEVDASVVRRVHAGDAWEVLLHRNIVTGATTTFRRQLAAIALPVPAGWLHDEWLAIVAAAVMRMDLSTELLVRYRQHGANQIGARKLSIAGKLGRMVESGGERNRRLLTRATSLNERIARLPGVPVSRIAETAAKLAHERVRSGLDRHRLTRVAPILREVRTGRYSAFGRGLPDAVRDLLQPLDPAS